MGVVKSLMDDDVYTMADIWVLLLWLHQNGRYMHTKTITTRHCFEIPSNMPQNTSGVE